MKATCCGDDGLRMSTTKVPPPVHVVLSHEFRYA
jgi:hypothetical protein